MGALLSLGVGTLLLHQPPTKQLLQDHPMCGIPTGGQVVYRVLKKNRTESINPKKKYLKYGNLSTAENRLYKPLKLDNLSPKLPSCHVANLPNFQVAKSPSC